MAAQHARVSELAVLVAYQGDKGKATATEFVALVATGTAPSQHTPVVEFVALLATQEEKIVAKVTETVMLVSYVTGATERFNSRAWGFNLDQHQFYVLHLGEQGTMVFDALTNEWSQWQTEGFNTWNAEHGVEWNDEVYFGDSTLPTLWRMDPDSFLDEDFRTIRRVVTGGIPTEARNTLRTGMFVLSATKGRAVDDEGTPYVQLSISDDGGQTFNDRPVIEMDNNTVQDFSWRSLGVIKTPGRVFKITDEGAIVTIKGANQRIDGEDEDDD